MSLKDSVLIFLCGAIPALVTQPKPKYELLMYVIWSILVFFGLIGIITGLIKKGY